MPYIKKNHEYKPQNKLRKQFSQQAAGYFIPSAALRFRNWSFNNKAENIVSRLAIRARVLKLFIQILTTEA